MLGKLRRLFSLLCLVFIMFACGIAQAKTEFVYSVPASKPQLQSSQQLFNNQQRAPANIFSLSGISLVSVGSRFSGDFNASVSAPARLMSTSSMKMDTALGFEGEYLHLFRNLWAIGLSVGWNPLTLDLPPVAVSNGLARISAQAIMNQYAGNVLVGGRIINSRFMRVRALLTLGLLYYRTTNAWAIASGRERTYLPYGGFGFLYGVRLEATLGGWVKGVHPILSIAYRRATQINIVSLQGQFTGPQIFPLVDKPTFTQSILMFGIGAAFIT